MVQLHNVRHDSIMDTQDYQNCSLDEFLIVVNSRDRQGAYIIPRPDVAARLSREIELRTGLTGSQMPNRDTRESRNWISAAPGEFIVATRLLVENLSAWLGAEGAARFELAFHNTQDDTNSGDRILAAIRYE